MSAWRVVLQEGVAIIHLHMSCSKLVGVHASVERPDTPPRVNRPVARHTVTSTATHVTLPLQSVQYQLNQSILHSEVIATCRKRHVPCGAGGRHLVQVGATSAQTRRASFPISHHNEINNWHNEHA